MPHLKRLKLWEKILFICINSLSWSIYHECFYIQSFLSYDYTFVLQRADKKTVPQTQQVQTLTWRPEVIPSSHQMAEDEQPFRFFFWTIHGHPVCTEANAHMCTWTHAHRHTHPYAKYKRKLIYITSDVFY